jgi:hypothetical protein
MCSDDYDGRPSAAPREGRRWWFNQPSPIDRFTGWLVAWTALLCVATCINAIVLWKTDHTLTDTLIANNRAWIWPEIEIDDDLDLAKEDFKFKMTLVNTGPAPATNVKESIELKPFMFSSPDSGRVDNQCKHISDDDFPVVKALFPGYVLFPQRPFSASAPASLAETINILKAASEKHERIYWQVSVCIRYDFAVASRVHQTSRRFFLIDSETKSDDGVFWIDPNRLFIERSKLKLVAHPFGPSFSD